MPTLAELLAQKTALEEQIAEVQRTEHAAAVAQVRALMAEHGLTWQDIGGEPGRAAGAPPSRSGRSNAAAAPRLPPKYRDPESGATWSGRGLKPRWLSVALDAGRSLDEFRI
jgi:DNA-binding protein H-NS